MMKVRLNFAKSIQLNFYIYFIYTLLYKHLGKKKDYYFRILDRFIHFYVKVLCDKIKFLNKAIIWSKYAFI